MPRLNRPSRRLQGAHARHQAAVFAAADRAALALDRAVAGVWQDLLAVLRTRHGHAQDYHRALAVLRRLPAVVAQGLLDRLLGLYRAGHAAAVKSVEVIRGVATEATARRGGVARGGRGGGPARGHDPAAMAVLLPGAAVRGAPLIEAAETGPPGVEFTRHEKSGRGEVLVMVDPARLDAAYARGHPDYYIPRGGGGGEIKGRRAEFERFLAKGKPIQASRVTYDPDEGSVDFIDGRHRFSVLRDLGVRAVGVMVPRKQADTFRELFAPPPEPETQPPAGDLFDRLLFPAPNEADVLRWLAPLIRPADWQRIGGDADRRLPEELAGAVATGLALGKTQREVAKDLLPFLDGSRVRARRAARTFGLVAAHQGQMDAWGGLEAAGLLVGYQIHATLDANTRPEHRRRDGTVYYKAPKAGQKGLGEMPRPPREADGSIAWNCRCYLTAVLL